MTGIAPHLARLTRMTWSEICQLRPIPRRHSRPSQLRQSRSLLFALCIIACAGALLLYVVAGYHGAFLNMNYVGAQLPDELWMSLTVLGDTRLAIALLLFYVYRHPQILPAALLAALPVTLIVQFFKRGMPVPRPASIFEPEQYHHMGVVLKMGSFPSGHSATLGLLAGFICLVSTSNTPRFLALGVLIMAALSRVMVGVHWPIDVLVGSSVGVLAALWSYRHAVRHRLCQHPLSQWAGMALVFYAAISLFANDCAYPDVHSVIMLLSGAALSCYFVQLSGLSMKDLKLRLASQTP